MYKILIILIGISFMNTLRASEVESEKKLSKAKAEIELKRRDSLTFYTDNDNLSSAVDQDYTGGGSLLYAGDGAAKHLFSINMLLTYTNRLLGLENKNTVLNLPFYSYELGLTNFTPEDINTSMPIYNDRPYSNLLFIANGQQSLSEDHKSAWVSSLTLGIIGTRAGGDIQNSIHKLIEVDEAKGWRNQISDGGEFTLKYELLRSKSLVNAKYFQLIGNYSASLGFLTEAMLGFEVRTGLLRSPWWSIAGNQSKVGSKTRPTTILNKNRDIYLFLGAQAKGRLHNSFIQGQFRSSKHKYSFSEVNQGIVEAWAGVNIQLISSLSFGYLYSFQTSEIKSGKADRDFNWGTAQVTYAF